MLSTLPQAINHQLLKSIAVAESRKCKTSVTLNNFISSVCTCDTPLFLCHFAWKLKVQQVFRKKSQLSSPQKKSSESFAIIVDAGNKDFSAPGNAALLDPLQNSNFTTTKIQKHTFFQKFLLAFLSVQTGRKSIFRDFC